MSYAGTHDYIYATSGGPTWHDWERPCSLQFRIEVAEALFKHAVAEEERQKLAMLILEELESALREQHARVNLWRGQRDLPPHDFGYPIEKE